MKSAKIFKNGQSQAVRLPREFRLQGQDVYVRKLGSAVILIPKGDPWATLRNSFGEFSEDFLMDRAQPSPQVREGL